MTGLCLVYLVREPEGLGRFAAAYAAVDPGARHRLLLVGRGRMGLNLAADFAQNGVFPKGTLWSAVLGPWHRSLSAFRQAADTWDCFDRFVFLNSWSRPLQTGWLSRLIDGIWDDRVGAASCTGSWESFRTNGPGLLNKVVPPFPNPSLRTNAIALRREDALRWLPKVCAFRRTEYLRESGAESLTRRCWGSGRSAVVVGVENYFGWREWDKAEAFRYTSPGGRHQMGLLVADNQTDAYEAVCEADRRELRRRAWEFA